jgi:mannan endo-1,4-beta-mannosidase
VKLRAFAKHKHIIGQPEVSQVSFGDRTRKWPVIAIFIVCASLGSFFIYQSFAANANLPGDINSDNKVDLTDLSMLLGKWNTNTATHDVNSDGAVNLQDLSILLSNWNKTYTPTTTPPTTPPSTPPAGTYKPGFVYRSGKNLMLDGAKYRFVGVNNYDLDGWHTGKVPSEADATTFFSNFPASGGVTRVWDLEPTGGAGMDQMVRLAEKYNVKLIVSLADGAENAGSPDFEAPWYSGGYKTDYFKWLETTIPKYKDSPAILAWEIMNEPGQVASNLTTSMMADFYETTAAKIKSLDPNHLVSSGSNGPWQNFQSGTAGYAAVHAGAHIDLVSLHSYDYPYNNSRQIISGHWATIKAAADQINKPAFIGETGITLPNGCVTAAERASVLKQMFDGYFAQGSSGILYWVVLGTPNNNDGTVCNSGYGTRDPINGTVMKMVKGYTFPAN